MDSHGQRLPLDLEIPDVHYVPSSTMNMLSTTHLNSQCGRTVLIVPGLPSQVSGVWGEWYQGYGQDGYPAIYLNLGEGKPVLRTNPVDDGKVWTKVSAAVEQVRIVITQSPPRPKGPLVLYVHTQKTVDHTLLKVAVCSTTFVIRLSVACETISTKERVVTNRVAYSLHAGLMP